MIAHISQATAGMHEGWGRPGTRWEGIHYRTFILDTFPEMRECRCSTGCWTVKRMASRARPEAEACPPRRIAG
jgi:hypothetical protein